MIIVGGFSPLYARMAETIGFEAPRLRGNRGHASIIAGPDERR
jgi:hypothetical protein